MEFRELKRKKERGVSNAELMDTAKDYFIDSETIVVVGMSSEGVIETYYTSATSLNAIGLIEVAKNQLLSEMEV